MTYLTPVTFRRSHLQTPSHQGLGQQLTNSAGTAGTQTLVRNSSGCTRKSLTYLKISPVTVPFHIWSIIWEFEEIMWNVGVSIFCLLSSSGWMGSEVTWKLLRHVQLFVALWTMLFMEFSKPEYWSGLPFPSPRDLPNPGIKSWSPALQEDSRFCLLSSRLWLYFIITSYGLWCRELNSENANEIMKKQVGI